MARFNEGDRVTWSWGNGHGSGRIRSMFAEKTTRKIDGTDITRHGSQDNPALYIDSDEGNNVLKLASECEPA